MALGGETATAGTGNFSLLGGGCLFVEPALLVLGQLLVSLV